jgi:hypothetical protein
MALLVIYFIHEIVLIYEKKHLFVKVNLFLTQGEI